MIRCAYKFLPPNLIKFLENRQLRFSQPSALNDPFESICFLPMKTRQQVIDEIADSELRQLATFSLGREYEALETLQIHLRRKQRHDAAIQCEYQDSMADYRSALRFFDQRYGILSLSSRWDSSLIWSHYAIRHHGFAVGFDPQHPFFSEQNQDRSGLREVTYGNSRLQLSMADDGPVDVLFYKPSDWSYEVEWRLIFDTCSKSLNKHVLPEVDQFELPIYLYEIPQNAILELVIGMEATQSVKESVKMAAKKWSIPVWQVKPLLEHLNLDRVLIHT